VERFFTEKEKAYQVIVIYSMIFAKLWILILKAKITVISGI